MKFLNKILKKKEAANADSAKKEKKEDGQAPDTKRTPLRTDRILDILRAPHQTEKSALLGGRGRYVFLIAKSANKTEVKRAVESRYGVAVKKIGMINLPAKERRRGRQIGWKPGLKKAIVTVKKGQSIEIQ